MRRNINQKNEIKDIKINKRLVHIILILVILVLTFVFIFVILRNEKLVSKKNNFENLDVNENNNQNEFKESLSEKEKVVVEIKEAKVPTLMYHAITDDLSYIEYSINAVSPVTFEEQLKILKEEGYDTLFFDDLDEVYKYKKPVILTFDDGFIDFYTNAFPLLKKYNIKATVFMVVNYINCENYCTLDALKEMRDSGIIKIESHTLTHPYLTSLSISNIEEQVNKSADLLNDYLGTNTNALCYPYGDYNNQVDGIVKKKYKFAITMDEGLYDMKVNSYYNIPRYTIARTTSLQMFSNLLSNSKVVL